MSFFWRMLLALLLALGAGLLSQRLLSTTVEGLPPIPQMAIADSPLTQHQAEIAFQRELTSGREQCLQELLPIRNSGLEVWLVTNRNVVGFLPAGDNEVAMARNAIRGKPPGIIPIQYRLIPLLESGERGVLLVRIPSLASHRYLVARVALFFAIPLLACFILARRFAQPIERIENAAAQPAAGELSHRVGPTSGPREVVKLGASFDVMAQRLQEIVESQKRLLADVSHEIRSPLARIRLAAQMLAEMKGDPAKNLQRIQTDVSRMDEFIGAVSALASPDTPIDRSEQIDLAELARTVLDENGPHIEEKSLAVQAELPEIWLSANRPLLHSALANVVQNAIRYSPQGGLLKVVTSAHPTRLSVSDQGPGVPETELEKIFEPFYRYSSARQRDTGGVGLGLAITRRVARAHDGDACAKINPDGGLTVRIDLA